MRKDNWLPVELTQSLKFGKIHISCLNLLILAAICCTVAVLYQPRKTDMYLIQSHIKHV